LADRTWPALILRANAIDDSEDVVSAVLADWLEVEPWWSAAGRRSGFGSDTRAAPE